MGVAKIIPPVKGKYSITSEFGWRVHPMTGKRRLHNGVDIVTGRKDTSIVAPEAGLVLEARKSTAPGGGYGYFVKYRGVSGATHLMAHMVEGSLTVKKGDRVKQGQKLGMMGTTGSSTGIHLHWEVRGRTFVDPIKWMNRQNA
jgi:murein DD-endopeptidase MepM/ murein hydrolase activator NlpD